jgi:adenylate cyclase
MRKVIFSPIWSLMVLGVLSYLFYINPAFIESLRLRYFDQLIINQPVEENNIYTVDIDESTIDEYGQWPFPRGDYAAIIEDLYARGAGLVVWNVLMSEPDRSGEDAELALTMQSLPVIVTMLGAEESKNEAINPGATIVNSDYRYLIPSVPGTIANIPDIEYSAVGSGITNSWPELDGVTRRIPLVIRAEDTDVLYPNVTMEVLRVLAGDPSFQIKLNELGVDKLRIPQFGFLQTLYRQQSHLVNQSRCVNGILGSSLSILHH